MSKPWIYFCPILCFCFIFYLYCHRKSRNSAKIYSINFTFLKRNISLPVDGFNTLLVMDSNSAPSFVQFSYIFQSSGSVLNMWWDSFCVYGNSSFVFFNSIRYLSKFFNWGKFLLFWSNFSWTNKISYAQLSLN
jgi:hypothetical protein